MKFRVGDIWQGDCTIEILTVGDDMVGYRFRDKRMSDDTYQTRPGVLRGWARRENARRLSKTSLASLMSEHLT